LKVEVKPADVKCERTGRKGRTGKKIVVPSPSALLRAGSARNLAGQLPETAE
jgi:hypothetical protein